MNVIYLNILPFQCAQFRHRRDVRAYIFYKLFVFIIYLCELNELVDAIDISAKWHFARADTFTQTDFPSAAIWSSVVDDRFADEKKAKKN